MGILPPGAAKAAAVSSVDSNIGGLVQYEDDGAVVLGVITGTKRDKFTVLNIRGREIELARPRLYRLPAGSTASGASTAAKTEALNAISGRIDKESEELNVEELWSFVNEECRSYSVSELCKSYFGDDTPEKHAGLRNALIKEKVHFKRDKDSFEPRSAQVVGELKLAEDAKRRKVTVRETTVACVTQRAKDPSCVIPHDVEENLKLMSEVAAGVAHTDPARQKEGKELVHLCVQSLKISENAPMEKQAFEVLLNNTTRGGFGKNRRANNGGDEMVVLCLRKRHIVARLQGQLSKDITFVTCGVERSIQTIIDRVADFLENHFEHLVLTWVTREPIAIEIDLFKTRCIGRRVRSTFAL